MTNQTLALQSPAFQPSRLNRLIAKIHIVINGAVLAFTTFMVIRLEIAIARSETGDFSHSAVHLIAGIIGLFAFGMLLLLVKCARNLRRPTPIKEWVTAWMMLFYFAFLSLIFGGLFFSSPAEDGLAHLVVGDLFFTVVVAFVAGLARIFSLPGTAGQQRSNKGGSNKGVSQNKGVRTLF
jgi:hypothetical protein